VAFGRLSDFFLKVCKALNKENVEYVIIGGFAMILHGYSRFTEDIDIFIKPTEKNVEKLKVSLRKLFDDDSIEEISHSDLLQYAVIRYGTPEGFYIDLIGRIGEIASYEEVDAGKEIKVVDDVPIPVCGVEKLLFLKEGTLRNKDKMDAIFLKEKLEKLKKG